MPAKKTKGIGYISDYQQVRTSITKSLLSTIRKFHMNWTYTLVQSQSLSYYLPVKSNKQHKLRAEIPDL
jgi:hypothetical protein